MPMHPDRPLVIKTGVQFTTKVRWACPYTLGGVLIDVQSSSLRILREGRFCGAIAEGPHWVRDEAHSSPGSEHVQYFSLNAFYCLPVRSLLQLASHA